MRLKDVSKFFDKTTARDAYGSTTFKCQIEPLDMYRTEGTRIKIRNMSTAPEVTIPARNVITIDGQNYLVSDGSKDHWNDTALRTRYVLQGADHLVSIRTIAQLLANTAGTDAYASIDFNKYSTDERDSSEYHPQYHIFFGGGETVPENAVLTTATGFYLVRNAYRTPAGLIDALSNQLDSPVTDAATFASRTYDPITDTYSDASSTVRCVRVRWQDSFAYLSQGSTKYERGDVQAFVPLSVTPKAGDKITLADGTWTILSVVTSEYHSLHLRRA